MPDLEGGPTMPPAMPSRYRRADGTLLKLHAFNASICERMGLQVDRPVPSSLIIIPYAPHNQPIISP